MPRMTRRDWFGLLTLPAWAPAAKVKITGMETFLVKVNRRGNWLLVRLQTSADVTGLGEASHGGNDALTTRPSAW